MAEYDLLAIGNAIVDVIARCDDAFLTDNKIQKSGMTLIDTERAEDLYGAMGPAIETSGGSSLPAPLTEKAKNCISSLDADPSCGTPLIRAVGRV